MFAGASLDTLCAVFDMNLGCGSNHEVHDNGDNPHHKILTTTWEACGQSCLSMDGCNAWAWIDPDGGNSRVESGRGKECWHKTSVYDASCAYTDSGIVSGVRGCPPAAGKPTRLSFMVWCLCHILIACPLCYTVLAPKDGDLKFRQYIRFVYGCIT